ncbi:hypothetical protein CMI37_11265 [Candidatus Pacearchaeota archaeon]|nr:hypothetical protein [Candidatus Pacearchaeota archaeon]
MAWIALLTGALKVTASLAKLAEQSKLLEAGEARAVAAGMGKSLDELQKVKDARNRLRDPSWRARLRKKFKARK